MHLSNSQINGYIWYRSAIITASNMSGVGQDIDIVPGIAISPEPQAL